MSHPPSTPSTPGTPSNPAQPAPASGLTYGSYLKVPELLSLQQCMSRPAHHDEMLFIISHQVYELWFKQMMHDLVRVCAYLDEDRPLRATQLFDRVHRVQHLLIEQIPLLETMFSVDFAAFRGALGTSSGFQSAQFRQLEFFCGKKNPNMLKLVGDDAKAKDAMAAYLDKATPYDHFLRHLAREDHNVFSIPADVLARDTRSPHALDERLVNALEVLYRKQGESASGERYYAQFRVAEHLLEFDEKLAIWRFHHVKMVERMIGTKKGTGGSSGAEYLAATLRTMLWPDLWEVRNRFGSQGPAYGAGPAAGMSGGTGAAGTGGSGGCPMGH